MKGKIKDFTKLLETQSKSNLEGKLKIIHTIFNNKQKYYLVKGKNNTEYYIKAQNIYIIEDANGSTKLNNKLFNNLIF